MAGNTDIAVADFDYGAAYPWLGDGVPESYRSAAEWAHEAIGAERVDWLRRLPAERRFRADDGTLVLVTPRLARLPDRRASTAAWTRASSWSAWDGPTPGSSAAATPTSPRSATSAGRWS